jgi:hypothetical protein
LQAPHRPVSGRWFAGIRFCLLHDGQLRMIGMPFSPRMGMGGHWTIHSALVYLKQLFDA